MPAGGREAGNKSILRTENGGTRIGRRLGTRRLSVRLQVPVSESTADGQHSRIETRTLPLPDLSPSVQASFLGNSGGHQDRPTWMKQR